MKNEKHKWIFLPRFRKNSFGWQSQPAIKRIKEAVSEIKKVARKDPVLGGEGAVLFLERVADAIEHVDGSSGAIGTAVNNAIETLVAVISAAPADDKLREKWLERLWQAVQDDGMPYIEDIANYWGELCVTPERASKWADRFIGIVRELLSPNPPYQGYFKGISLCLSSLLKAGRNEEILELLERSPYKFWHDRQFGVKALVAMGKKAEAIRCAEDRGLNDNSIEIAQVCEGILISSGMAEEAYRRYAIEANRKTTYIATFNAIAEKYPHKKPVDVLHDLVASTPHSKGKWFATAKSLGFFDYAIELANSSPCDPMTLARAARDTVKSEPRFAVESGVAAMRWLVDGYGFEITGLDVWTTYRVTIEAAENAGCKPEALERIRKLVASNNAGSRFVEDVLGKELGLK